MIEPDYIYAKIYSKYFNKLGFPTSIAKDAQSALNSINELSPDIILMSMDLVKHSSIELIHEIRSYADLDDIRIVLLSSIPKKEYLSRFPNFLKQYKILDYIYRPDSSLSSIAKIIA